MNTLDDRVRCHTSPNLTWKELCEAIVQKHGRDSVEYAAVSVAVDLWYDLVTAMASVDDAWNRYNSIRAAVSDINMKHR